MSSVQAVCPHCGRHAPPARPPHDVPLTCPSCRRQAVFVPFGTVKVDHCRRCGGTWFDEGEIDALPTGLSEADAATNALATLRSLVSLEQDADVVKYLNCPVCDRQMLRRNYEDVSGVILNRCVGHGAWLDHVNTIALLKLIAEGRLPEVRERAQAAARARAESDQADHDAKFLEQLSTMPPRFPHPPASTRLLVRVLLGFFDG